MALASPIESFIWGAGGSKKTPEQIAREREIAEALLMKAGNTAPVGHWTQGATRVVDALSGVLKQNRADTAEREGRAGGDSAFASIMASLGGGAPVSSGTSALGPASVPQGADAASIRQGLIARGLPEHIADGFLMNFQDESGLNPGINEAAPTVPGSRGGYGLYQLTGPRRVAYEQYAAQKGVDPSNIDAQLDFMMSELQGPESRAAQSILAAPDAGSAAAAIARDFLRPAPEHLNSRVAKYTAGVAPVQVASLDPSIGAPVPQAQQLPAIAPPAAEVPAQQQIAQALIGGGQSAPVMAQGGGMPSMQQLAEAAANPWLSESQRSIINSLLGQQMEQQQQANDPLRQLQIQAAQQEMSAPIEVGGVLLDRNTMQPIFDSRTSKGAGLINAGDGNIYNPANGEWITAPSGAGGQLTDTQRNLAWRAEQAGLAAGTPEYAEFMRSGGQSTGMALSVGPDGTVQFAQGGAGMKALTEGQSKDAVFVTRANNALPTIDKYESALLSLGENVAGNIPYGNYLQSEEYQVARDAGREFLATVLRKDTGAAVTPSEESMYGDMLLPRPGDKPATIEMKRRRRAVAVAAIEAGMPPQAILNSVTALEKVGVIDPQGAVMPDGMNAAPPNQSQAPGGDIDALLRKYEQ